MTPSPFTEAATGYANAFRPQFDQMFRLAQPPVETDIADRITGWLDLCHADPAAGFEEHTLGRVLEGLVTLMHSRMTFGIARRARYGARPDIVVTGDVGGAVLASDARQALLRLLLRHDRDMAARLAQRVLRRLESQRCDIADALAALA